AVRHVDRVHHQPAGRLRAPAPVLVQPRHRQRVVRQPARPARRRAFPLQPGPPDHFRAGAPRHRRTRAPGRPRLAGSGQCAAQLCRPRRRARAAGVDMINEFRRARRRKAADTILVTDAMTERAVGRIGNLSESGMLLIASETLVDDALYQLQFTLPGDKAQPETLEVGAHLLWMDRASAPSRARIGLRFSAVAAACLSKLQKRIEAPGGQYVKRPTLMGRVTPPAASIPHRLPAGTTRARAGAVHTPVRSRPQVRAAARRPVPWPPTRPPPRDRAGDRSA